MFTSIPTMPVMVAAVDSENERSGVLHRAAPVNLASPDLRQILSPRLTNTHNMDICSPTPGSSTLDRDHEIARLKREILKAHEDARRERKAADKARSDLLLKEKEFDDVRAQVMFLGQKSSGYEAELAVAKSQLKNSLICADIEALRLERDLYREQEKTAVAERDASRKKERVTRKKLVAERKARTKAEEECHAAVQRHITTTSRRENFKAIVDGVRRERDNMMERLYLTEECLKKREAESTALKTQVLRFADRLQKSAQEHRERYGAALATMQQEYQTTFARMQQEHKAMVGRIQRGSQKVLAAAQQARRQGQAHLDAAMVRLSAAEASNEELQARLSAAESSYGELQGLFGNARGF